MAQDSELSDKYLREHAIKVASGTELINSLRRVLSQKEPEIYEDSLAALPKTEQQILTEGGARLRRSVERDLVAETAVQFAALVENSLSSEEVAKRLKISASRVRQMVSERTLYTFHLNGKRWIPSWQLLRNSLVPNIGEVNQAIPKTLHPVGVTQWFHRENPELYVDDNMELLRTPRQWLTEGREHSRVAFLAASL